MTNCTEETINFPPRGRRCVEARFNGGCVSNNGGVMHLRQADDHLGLLEAVAAGFPDGRQPGKVRHRLIALLRQRIFAIALGYEDLNDHDMLRHDVPMQTALGCDVELASAPTLCRLENSAGREVAVHIHKVLVDQYIASHRRPPKEVVLDFDATDDPVHGQQVGRFFHAHYDRHCFLPLYVFAGEHPLVAYLRPANIDAAKHSAAIARLLVGRLRRAWPDVRIVVRGDSGFCRSRLMDWCDRNGVHYILGLARNSRVEALAEPEKAQAEAGFEATGEKQRRFADLVYGARSWSRERRVVARLEHGPRGANPRFVVTNLEGDAQSLYEDIYCARGDMENRIKEQQLHLFADRTSCHDWWPNQLRLLLATVAYVLLMTIRRVALWGTRMARAQAATIRLRLLRIGAVVVRNTRRVRFMLSSACPDKDLFALVARRLEPG